MAETVKREVEFLLETASLSDIRNFTREVLRSAGLQEKAVRLVVVASDEAVTSIVRQARADQRQGMIAISIDVDDVRIRISIADSGNLFDPGSRGVEELSRFIEGRRSLEIGIFLIRQVMDEIEYVYRKGFENQLVLTKFLC